MSRLGGLAEGVAIDFPSLPARSISSAPHHGMILPASLNRSSPPSWRPSEGSATRQVTGRPWAAGSGWAGQGSHKSALRLRPREDQRDRACNTTPACFDQIAYLARASRQASKSSYSIDSIDITCESPVPPVPRSGCACCAGGSPVMWRQVWVRKCCLSTGRSPNLQQSLHTGLPLSCRNRFRRRPPSHHRTPTPGPPPPPQKQDSLDRHPKCLPVHCSAETTKRLAHRLFAGTQCISRPAASILDTGQQLPRDKLQGGVLRETPSGRHASERQVPACRRNSKTAPLRLAAWRAAPRRTAVRVAATSSRTS